MLLLVLSSNGANENKIHIQQVNQSVCVIKVLFT